jgi:N-acetylglucosamine kinase
MTLLLAIDGGGTRTRCIAVDQDGGIRGHGEAGPSNHLHVPMEVATAALRTATAAALAVAGAAATDVELVSAGLAGVDFDGTGAPDGASMLRAIGFDRAAVFGDMVIAHRGALAGAAGVVALAGTGSSVLGIGDDGTMIKAGGWGPLYGDGGSAYQLGRLGLVAAAEAYDESGPMTSLLQQLPAVLEVEAFPDTVKRLYSHLSGQLHVAALASVVDACAEAGDEVAAGICRQAGSDLARSVMAVIHRVPLREKLVSYQGGVLRRSRLVRASFVAALTADRPGLEVRPPRFDPIFGAVLLGAEAAGWPLPVAPLEVRHGV